MTTPTIDEYFSLIDDLATEAISKGHTATSLFDENPPCIEAVITKVIDIRRRVMTDMDIERVKSYLDLGLLPKFNSEDRSVAILCLFDLEERIELRKWIRSCDPYTQDQPLFDADPSLWHQTYPSGKADKEMIRCSALTFEPASNLVTVGCSKASIHWALPSQLFSWLRENFRASDICVRVNPHEVSPDLLSEFEEVALRSADPDWWQHLKVWPGHKKASVYELEQCDCKENFRRYWDREVKKIGRLEVAFQRNNSGLLSCMIEELPRPAQNGFIVGYCVHLTSESPVGTSWDQGITTHIDGAVNVYYGNAVQDRFGQSLEHGKTVKASCRTHLFRVDTAPLASLLPIAYQFFRSECLVLEWLEDQFGVDHKSVLRHK